MKENFKELKDTFNTSSSEIESVVENDIDIKIEKMEKKSDIDSDYQYTRANLYSIIEKGQEAINNALDIASESDSPRAYEVAGQLIKNVSDVTDKLLDLQKKVKDLKNEGTKGPSNVTNALFVGSTAELSKLLRQQKNNNDK